MNFVVYRPLRVLWISAMATSVGLALLLIVLRNMSRDPVVWFYIAMGGGLFVVGGVMLIQSLRWTWRWLHAFWS